MARILLADCDSKLLDLLERFLVKIDHTIVAAERTGEASIRAAIKYKPDLVLTEVVLQGEMDGIETAGILKDELGIPVIFITAYADGEYRERAKRTEPYGYILKPFHLSQIQATIDMALYQESVEEPLREMG